MRSIQSIKGFKNDKRNLLEATNNLIVFGEGRRPDNGISKGRRRIRTESSNNGRSLRTLSRGGVGGGSETASHATRSRSRTTQPLSLVPGPNAAMRRLDQLTHFDVMSNYFHDTRPWKQLSTKGSNELTAREREQILAMGSSMNQDPTATSTLSYPESVVRSSSQVPGQSQFIKGSDTYVQAHVCPICSEGFEPVRSKVIPASDIMKFSMQMYNQKSSVMFRKNLEDGWAATAGSKPKKCVKPQEVVVSANCGELFHKVCLRDWCSQGHKTSPRMMKPSTNCPCCGKELKYTLCQEIEVNRSFTYEPTGVERELIQTKLVNKELQVLWPETSCYLGKLQDDIKEAETLQKELRSKKKTVKSQLKKLTPEDLSIIMSKVTDPVSMNIMLDKQEKALEFMQQETLQIMRMYLLTVLRKRNHTDGSSQPPPVNGNLKSSTTNNNTNIGANAADLQVGESSNPVPYISIIPSTLAPYLQSILNDDFSLHLLSRILVPMPEDYDEAKLKLLELEILRKHDPNYATKLARTNTYTVFSSVAEVGETESEGKGLKKKGDNHSSSHKNLTAHQDGSLQSIVSSNGEDDNRTANLVKAVSGLHQFQTENVSCIDLLLNPKAFSDLSIQAKKPSKIFQVEQIESDTECDMLTINSSADLVLQKKKDAKTDEEIKSVVLMQNQVLYETKSDKKDEKEDSIEELDFVSPLANYPLAPSFKPIKNYLQEIERNSRRTSSLDVSAISLASQNHQHHPTTHPTEDDNVDDQEQETSAVTIVTTTIKQEDDSVNTIMKEVDMHPSNSSINRLGKSSSATNLNNLSQICKSFENDGAAAAVAQVKATDSSNILVAEAEVRISNTSTKAEELPTTAAKKNEKVIEIESDSSWSTVSSDNEEQEQEGNDPNEAGVKALVLDSKDNMSLQVAPIPLPTHRSSCQLVFSNSGKKKSNLRKKKNNAPIPGRRVTLCHGQIPKHSDTSLTGLPEKQLSIAIMYIIDDDGEGEAEGGEEESSSERGESTMDLRGGRSRSILPPPVLQSTTEKPITPVYVKAQKTSIYSDIAEQMSQHTSSSSDNGMVLDMEELRQQQPGNKPSAYGKTRLEMEQYRPPTVSSWSNGVGLTERLMLSVNKEANLPQFKTNNKKDLLHVARNGLILKPSLPNINKVNYKTKMFYENEVSLLNRPSVNRLVNVRNNIPF